MERFVAAHIIPLKNLFIEIVIHRMHLLTQVYRLRLLGDYHHSTRIAFVEFVMVRSVFFSIILSDLLLHKY